MVNWIQIHLAINHFPIVGSVIALALLMLCLVTSNLGIIRLSLSLSLIFAAFSIPAYFSGEFAESLAEQIQAIDDEQMGNHHRAAKTTALLGGLTAVFSALALGFVARLDRRGRMLMIFGNLLLNAFLALSAGYTGHLGGLLRHPELERIPDASIAPEPRSHHNHHH